MVDKERLAAEMPYKWRVQSFSKYKPEATCVAYIDSRQVMDRLDEVAGIESWQRDHKEIHGNLYAGIGIFCQEIGWVWKWDCGVESKTEKEKGESSDSFKRAGVNWGIGRFLYELAIVHLPANEIKREGKYPHVVDKDGKRVWDLTTFINNLNGKTYKAPPKKQEKATIKFKPETSIDVCRTRIEKGFDFLNFSEEAKEKKTDIFLNGEVLYECKNITKLNQLLEYLSNEAKGVKK